MGLLHGKPRTLGQQTKSVLKNLERYLPGYAQAIQNINQSAAPQAQQLNYDLYNQFAPQFARAGADIQGIEQQGEIRNNIASLLGGGGDLVGLATEADRLANPEFYSTREAAGKGFNDLIGGMDPNKLTGSELANVERGVNRLNARTGNLNTGDATTTASNALQFDDRLQSKRAAFGQALNLFPGISQASRSPINAFQVGTGKTATQSNPGSGNYNATAGNVNQTAQGLTNTMFGTGQSIEGFRQQPTSITSTVQGAVGSVCGCYIFREHYGFPDVPEYIRWCRDFYYRKDPRIKSGYKRMANWIVPLMQKYKIVRLLMTYSCIFPLAAYGKYLTGYCKWGKLFKPAKIWLKFWSFYGV